MKKKSLYTFLALTAVSFLIGAGVGRMVSLNRLGECRADSSRDMYAKVLSLESGSRVSFEYLDQNPWNIIDKDRLSSDVFYDHFEDEISCEEYERVKTEIRLSNAEDNIQRLKRELDYSKPKK